VSPAEFDELRQAALKRGFLECMAGPLVRSSYRAEQALNRNNAGLDNARLLTVDQGERAAARLWPLSAALPAPS